MDIDSEEPQNITDEDKQQTVSHKDIQLIYHTHNNIQSDDSENNDCDENIVRQCKSHHCFNITYMNFIFQCNDFVEVQMYPPYQRWNKYLVYKFTPPQYV